MTRGAKPVARDRALARSGIGEDAVEGLHAVFLEVVVAQAAGQVEAVVDRPGPLAEERELVQLVAAGPRRRGRRVAAPKLPCGGDAAAGSRSR